MSHCFRRNVALLIFAFAAVASVASAQSKPAAKTAAAQPSAPALTPDHLKGFEFRNIGPAIMGGRIDDFAVVESNPSVFYVGTASGGILKTTNNGTTFEPVFDDQLVSSIGDIAIAPSDPQVV